MSSYNTMYLELIGIAKIKIEFKYYQVVEEKYKISGICCTRVFDDIQPPSEDFSFIESCCKVESACSKKIKRPVFDFVILDQSVSVASLDYPDYNLSVEQLYCLVQTIRSRINSGNPPLGDWAAGLMDMLGEELSKKYPTIEENDCGEISSDSENCTWDDPVLTGVTTYFEPNPNPIEYVEEICVDLGTIQMDFPEACLDVEPD